VWESHVTWGTPVQSFVFLGLLVFELEPMYATSDRWTDGRTDRRTTDADDRLMPPPPLRRRGHNNTTVMLRGPQFHCICLCVTFTFGASWLFLITAPYKYSFTHSLTYVRFLFHVSREYLAMQLFAASMLHPEHSDGATPPRPLHCRPAVSKHMSYKIPYRLRLLRCRPLVSDNISY